MTKLKSIIALFTLSSLILFSPIMRGLTFDITDFNKKFATVEWLCLYDTVAWLTSDVLMTENKEDLKRLGPEWFCFQTKDEKWHAVYGKYENETMNVIFHYLVDANSKVARTTDPVDATFLNLHARALITANSQCKEIKDSVRLRFNHYIKQNEDKTFSVWIFPAFQPNNLAVYGGEFIYKIDKTGTKILENNSYYQGDFKGFKVDNPREVWMDYTELEKPTLGSVFFVWYYKKYFTKINLDNKLSRSTVIETSDNNYSWVHIEKDVKTGKKTKEAKGKKDPKKK